MSTTIRIEALDKDRLRHLQEEWRKARGEHASQQELVSKALEYLESHWDEFLQETTWKPIPPAEINALRRRLSVRIGRDASKSVDSVLYGRKP